MIYEFNKETTLAQNVSNVLAEEGIKENAKNIFGVKIVPTKGDYKAFLSDVIKDDHPTLFVGVEDYDGDGVCSAKIIDMRNQKMGLNVIDVNAGKLEKALTNDEKKESLINELVEKFHRYSNLHFSTGLLPNRYTDHYGLGMSIMKKINIIVEAFKKTFGGNVEIFIETADNGIRSNEAIAYANSLGYRVMVTDHHQAVGDLPDAEVIVNPHTCPQPNLGTEDICGATVCALIAADFLQMPLAKCFEYAAVATITDVMPLVKENLFLVRWFLDRANKGKIGDLQLEVLLNATGASLTAVTADDIGFGVGPLVNACGRLETADIAFNFFKERDSRGRYDALAKIFNLNEKRKVLSFEYTTKAMQGNINSNMIVSAVDGCPEGILGIVSAHVTEKTNRPSGILARAEDGTYTGSFRSIEGFNLLENATKVFNAHPEIVVRYGGHAGAMGATLKDLNSLDVFREEMSKLFKPDELDLQEKSYIKYDDNYTLGELYEEFYKYQPFGEGRAKPIFITKKVMYGIQDIKSMHESWASYFGGKRVTCYNFNCTPNLDREGQEHTFTFSIHKSVKIVKNQLKVTYEPYVEEILD